MRLPDLMTIPSSRALAYVLLLGIGASFLGLLIPTILGGRGSELGVLALMLAALPAIYILPLKTELEDYSAWFKQWMICAVYYLGLSVSFSVWCVTRSVEAVWSSFGFVANLPEVKMITLAQGHFPTALELIPHNVGVALATGILTFIYGVAGGSMLLTWNVCVWSVALTMLVRRSAELYGYGPGILAVFPHSVIELFAYTLVIVATARFRSSRESKAVERNLIVVMLLVALMVIVIAAVVEASWPHWVLEQ